MLRRHLGGFLLLGILAAISATAIPASARFPHGVIGGGGPPPTGCAAWAVDNGCTQGVINAGLFTNPTAFTDFRQSSQPQYFNSSGVQTDHPVNWNVPGVDYGIGPKQTKGASLDPTTSVPSGCSYSGAGVGGHYVRCNVSFDIEGYWFNGVGIYDGNTSGTATGILKNDYFTLTAQNCRGFYAGLAVAYDHIGATAWTAQNNKFDFDTTCSPVANLYKQASDPGLTQQSTGTAAILGTALTYTGTPTGNVQIGQFIDCSGCTEPAMITAGSGLSWTLSVSQPTLGPLTVTTGPVQTDVLGDIGGGVGGTFQYNASLGLCEFYGMSGVAGLTAQYNYHIAKAYGGEHCNYIVSLPQPGGTSTIPVYNQDGNFIAYDTTSSWQAGTGVIDEFSTSGPANTKAPSGYQVTTTQFEASNNVCITNNTTNNGTGATVGGGCFTILTQGPTTPGDANNTAVITFSMTAGTLNVATIVSGGPLAPNYYVRCAFAGCAGGQPIQIVAQLTGTTGLTCGADPTDCNGTTGTYSTTTSYTAGTQSSVSVYLYPGVITSVSIHDNGIDATGALNGYLRLDPNVPVGSFSQTNNLNLLTGTNF